MFQNQDHSTYTALGICISTYYIMNGVWFTFKNLVINNWKEFHHIDVAELV